VKGWPQNASHFNFEEFIPEEDASLVKILRDAGAGKSSSSISLSPRLSFPTSDFAEGFQLTAIGG